MQTAILVLSLVVIVATVAYTIWTILKIDDCLRDIRRLRKEIAQIEKQTDQRKARKP